MLATHYACRIRLIVGTLRHNVQIIRLERATLRWDGDKPTGIMRVTLHTTRRAHVSEEYTCRRKYLGQVHGIQLSRYKQARVFACPGASSQQDSSAPGGKTRFNPRWQHSRLFVYAGNVGETGFFSVALRSIPGGIARCLVAVT